MMKRLGSSDSFGALMSICPNSTDDEPSGMMLDEDVEEFGRVSEKKRRLRVDQVKALEKNFEVENKLEPDRKVKLAQDLGLQPRQVAVWFQNRRARWKTKQLERDYGVLKANHDALKAKFETLQKDNQSLLIQIDELKSKICVKSEGVVVVENSSSYSSAVVNNEDSNSSTPPVAVVMEMGGVNVNLNNGEKELESCYYQQELVKIEEHNLLGEEECCSSLFCDDQPPSLQWYCSDQWN